MKKQILTIAAIILVAISTNLYSSTRVHITQDDTEFGLNLTQIPFVYPLKQAIYLHLRGSNAQFVTEAEDVVIWLESIRFTEGSTYDANEVSCKIKISKRAPEKNFFGYRIKGTDLDDRIIEVKYSFSQSELNGISNEILNSDLIALKEDDRRKFYFAYVAGQAIANWIKNNVE